jgi:hypothetical protein
MSIRNLKQIAKKQFIGLFSTTHLVATTWALSTVDARCQGRQRIFHRFK